MERWFLSPGGREIGVKEKKDTDVVKKLVKETATSSSIVPMNLEHEAGNVPIGNSSGPISYAKLLNGEPSTKSVNLRTLIASTSNGGGRKCVAYPVFENYVKNTWNKYDLVKFMMTTKGTFFFNFSSKDGMDAMIENDPWLIRSVSLILKKRTLDANFMTEDVCNIHV
ncbi:RNA-directed DNA polymerase, eukaryota, reverse transcriptase zinc-binding domain protein [Tanacetum coccineum]